MADIIYVTPPIVIVGSGAFYDTQPTALMPYAAIDVGQYDFLSLSVLAISAATSGAASVTVQIMHGMQTDSIDSWLQLTSAIFTGAGGGATTQSFGPGGFLRYVTWRVQSWTNMTTFGFCIRGIGRKRALALSVP
jgi:hypothetical protein